MKANQITKQVVALLVLSLMGACMGIPESTDGSKSSKKEKHVTANAVGNSIAPLFASLRGNQMAALKTSRNPSSDEKSTFPLCDLDGENEEGVRFSNDIPSDHYGLKDNGVDIESDTSCNTTGFTYWELDEVTGEDCAGDEMTISRGSGVAGYASASDGEEVLVILGTLKVDGIEITCNIFLTDSSFEAECEVDGEALETDSCPSTDDSSSDDSEEEESDWSDDSGDDSGDATDPEDCPPDAYGSHGH